MDTLDHMRTKGFTLLELVLVVSIIAFITLIFVLDPLRVFPNQRDKERQTQINRFVTLIEQYRNQTGAYVCGDDCQKGNDGKWYAIDCSADYSYQRLTGSANNSKEKSGFLNGGDCCTSADSQYVQYGLGGHSVAGNHNEVPLSVMPATDFRRPTSTGTTVTHDLRDDRFWGLYATGYTASTTLPDPYEGSLKGKELHYCYATLANDRSSYALYAKMESSSLNSSDNGNLPLWYEIYSQGYPATKADRSGGGWWPPASYGWDN